MARTRSRLSILLVAEESAGVQVLRGLLSSGHRLHAVLTSPPAEAARGATVWHLARTRKLPVLPPERVRDPEFAAEIRDQGIDLLLNVHSLFLIRREILAVPSIGGFNLHPGPLPERAGLNVPSWSIYEGAEDHGVSVHWMNAGVDAGPIAYERRFPIADDDTGLTLSGRCVREGVPLIFELLETASRDPSAIPRVEQDLDRRRVFGRGVPGGGRLDWERPARHVVDLIRAASFHPLPSPWGEPHARLGGEPIAFLGARRTGRPADAAPGEVREADGTPFVACADEWVEPTRVRWRGSVRPAAAVLRDGGRLQAGA